MPLLAEMSWEKAEMALKETSVAVVPVGAVHDHGPSPMGVDYLAPTRIAQGLSSKTKAVVLPPICYASNESYMGWHAGTINVSPKALYYTGLGICESLYEWGIRKVLFVNGHGGSTPALEEVARRVYYGRKRMLVAIAEWWNLVKEIYQPVKETISTQLKDERHVSANYIEASAALAIDPKCLETDKVRLVQYKQIFGSKIIPIKVSAVKFEDGTIRMTLRNKDIENDMEKLCVANEKVGEGMLEAVTSYLSRFILEFERLKIPSE